MKYEKGMQHVNITHVFPTSWHDVIDDFWTVRRFWQPKSARHLFNYLRISLVSIRHLTAGKNLPHEDTFICKTWISSIQWAKNRYRTCTSFYSVLQFSDSLKHMWINVCDRLIGYAGSKWRSCVMFGLFFHDTSKFIWHRKRNEECHSLKHFSTLTVWPDVGFAAEATVSKYLRGSPLDGKFGT